MKLIAPLPFLGALLFLPALSPAQLTFVRRYDSDMAYSGVSADESLVQLNDWVNGGSRLVRADGSLVHLNEGYFGGGVSNGGRESLGQEDEAGSRNGYVRSPSGTYRPTLGAGGEYLANFSSMTDPVRGHVAFSSSAPDDADGPWGVDSGNGPAEIVASDGVFGANGFYLTSVSASGAVTGVGVDSDEAFWRDAAGFHPVPLAAGEHVGDLRFNVDGAGETWITGLLYDDGGDFGSAWKIVNGTAVRTGLRVDRAYVAAGSWGSRSAFLTPDGVFAADLTTSTLSQVFTEDGSALTGATSVFVRGSGLYVTGGFGSGTVQSVPEPAGLMALGLGGSCLVRRKVARRSAHR